jgi:hypothetical protein
MAAGVGVPIALGLWLYWRSPGNRPSCHPSR